MVPSILADSATAQLLPRLNLLESSRILGPLWHPGAWLGHELLPLKAVPPAVQANVASVLFGVGVQDVVVAAVPSFPVSADDSGLVPPLLGNVPHRVRLEARLLPTRQFDHGPPGLRGGSMFRAVDAPVPLALRGDRQVRPPGAHFTPLQIPDGTSPHLLLRVEVSNQGQSPSVVLSPWGRGPPLCAASRIVDWAPCAARRSASLVSYVLAGAARARSSWPQRSPRSQPCGSPACRPSRSSRNPASRARGPTAPAQSRLPSYGSLCGGVPRGQRAWTWARGSPLPRASGPLAQPRSPRRSCTHPCSAPRRPPRRRVQLGTRFGPGPEEAKPCSAWSPHPPRQRKPPS